MTAGEDQGAVVLPRRVFLGVPFTPLPLEQALDTIIARPPGAPFAFVVTPNAQHTVGYNRGDPYFTQPAAKAWLVLNDSRILRLIAQRMFGEPLALCAGSDLAAELITHRLAKDTPITLIGGSDEVEARLRSMFGLTAITRYNPPMGFYRDPVEIDRCARFVIDHPARYTFLVVGSPQSERVALRVSEIGGGVGIGLCVGGSLNFVTGIVRRTPKFFRQLNLEWLYRLGQNPIGHARRVFVESAPVLLIALRAKLAGRPERGTAT